MRPFHAVSGLPQFGDRAVERTQRLVERAFRQHALQQGNRGDLRGGYPVFLQETRQLPVGIEHEAVLAGPVHGAGEEGVYHLHGFVRPDEARCERGHLALEH